MEWNLSVNKIRKYDLGYPTSKLFRKLLSNELFV
jgi:hypothetical protein